MKTMKHTGGLAAVAILGAALGLTACADGYSSGTSTSVGIGVTSYDGYRGGHRNSFRDQDWDGVPNRYDRDRDGDGVPNRFDGRPNNPYWP